MQEHPVSCWPSSALKCSLIQPVLQQDVTTGPIKPNPVLVLPRYIFLKYVFLPCLQADKYTANFKIWNIINCTLHPHKQAKHAFFIELQ